MATIKDKEMNHYVYQINNKTTGEYYIGKRSCSSSIELDEKYMGSGTLIKKALALKPDDNWEKEILAIYNSEEEAYAGEAELIGDKWLKDCLCLNIRPGFLSRSNQPTRKRTSTSSFKVSFRIYVKFNKP